MSSMEFSSSRLFFKIPDGGHTNTCYRNGRNQMPGNVQRRNYDSHKNPLHTKTHYLRSKAIVAASINNVAAFPHFVSNFS